jgi:hypothetical protein
MGSITCDEGQRPLVTIAFEGAVSDEVFETQYLSLLQRLVRRDEKRVILFDSRKSGTASAKQRQLQAQWMRNNKAQTKANTLGCVFVLDSVFSRGALTAILWLQPMPCPHAVVSNMDAALEKASQWLAAEGLTIPPVPNEPMRQVISG